MDNPHTSGNLQAHIWTLSPLGRWGEARRRETTTNGVLAGFMMSNLHTNLGVAQVFGSIYQGGRLGTLF